MPNSNVRPKRTKNKSISPLTEAPVQSQGAKAARVFGRALLASIPNLLIPNLLATLASWRFFSASLHDVMNDGHVGLVERAVYETELLD